MKTICYSMGAAALLTTVTAGALAAQAPAPPLPFGIGEALVYQVRAGRLGKIGTAMLRVEGPDSIRGRESYRLNFELKGRVGPFAVDDQTRSWIDPVRLTALRYEKRERHPLSSKNEEVELFPAERRWASADGAAGATPSDQPLDELSFIYLLRTLELEDGAEIPLERHYQAEKNPVLVRVVRREKVALPSGVFATVLVEMHVRDGKRFNGSGVIRFNLTDDADRYPVRIETAMPAVGALVLELEALTPASGIPLQRSGLLLDKVPPKPDTESGSARQISALQKRTLPAPSPESAEAAPNSADTHPKLLGGKE